MTSHENKEYLNAALALTGSYYNKLASVELDPIQTQYLVSKST